MPEPDDELWAVDPDAFVAARAALVKERKAAGDKEGAAAIAARRRPPYTVWALNTVAREEPDVVQAALDAGADLQAAMDAAVQGDRSGVSDAQRAEREATAAAVAAASSRIEAHDHQVTDAFKQRMTETIRAGQLDPEVAARLVAGRLEVDEAASIFGIAAPSPSPARARSAKPVAKKKAVAKEAGEKEAAPTREERAAAREAARAAERAEVERRREAIATYARLDGEATRLAKRADRLEDEARQLRAQADAAEQEAEQTRAAATEARRRAAEAEPTAD